MVRRVGIIDYGFGNLSSVIKAIHEVGAEPLVITEPKDIYKAEALILPGVGGFSRAAKKLEEDGWKEAISAEVLLNQKRLLGICLGMQLLAEFGDEGSCAGEVASGLGLIKGRIEHLKAIGCKLRVPHTGWNSILAERQDSLLSEIPSGTDFYFVHSYVFLPAEKNTIICSAQYGIPFAAIIRKENIYGVQFHPEKSSKAGLALLRNFIWS